MKNFKNIFLLAISLSLSSCAIIEPSNQMPSIAPSVSIGPSYIPPSPTPSPSPIPTPSLPSVSVEGDVGNSDNTTYNVTNGVATGLYTPGANDKLEVISIEPLQQYGDSTLFKYGNFELLIDTNNYESFEFVKVTSTVAQYIDDGVLEMFVATHPHGDHVGGFSSNGVSVNDFLSNTGIKEIKCFIDSGGVNNNYWENAKPVLRQKTTYDYTVYDMFYGSEAYKSYPYIFSIANDVYVEILNTGEYVVDGTYVDDPNEVSVALVFHYGNYKYLMCGDLNSSGESGLQSRYPGYFEDENYVIAKTNHHGSSNGSNTKNYVEWVKPDKVLVSAAIVNNNRVSNENTPAGAQCRGSSSKAISTSGQHPHVGALNNYVTYGNIGLNDLYWNGINGTLHFAHDSITSDPVITGEGRSYDYYYPTNYSGNTYIKALYQDEINVPFYRSHWAKTWNKINRLTLPTEE